jgi:hypothetical protein
MNKPLKLGLFQFKNDTVLLLVATPAAAVALAQQLESALENGPFKFALHEIAQVSTKHPAKLFVSSSPKAR